MESVLFHSLLPRSGTIYQTIYELLKFFLRPFYLVVPLRFFSREICFYINNYQL